jgi:predicted site-specific integrase-resolvase
MKQTIQSRYVTLKEWAAMEFSRVPHVHTLMRWAREGHIQPQPEKVGKSWQVKRGARYVE